MFVKKWKKWSWLNLSITGKYTQQLVPEPWLKAKNEKKIKNHCWTTSNRFPDIAVYNLNESPYINIDVPVLAQSFFDFHFNPKIFIENKALTT